MMNDYKQYSDEHLNAFIDNQLNTADRAEILDAIRHDAELSQRVCKLQKLQNMVQLSYQSVDVPERHRASGNTRKSSDKFKWFAAASFLLAVGSVVGWLSNQMIHSNTLAEIASIQHSPLSVNNADNWKLMLHVSTANPNRLNIVLDEAEALLKQYANSSRKLELEILTNSDGLALVTDKGRAYNKQLQDLQKKYKNLAVVVCGQTLNKMQKIQGKKLRLLPNTQVIPSAIKQIVKRQQSGWSYIRI